MKKQVSLLKRFRVVFILVFGALALFVVLPIAAKAPIPLRDVLGGSELELREDSAIKAPFAAPNLQVVHLAPFAKDPNGTAVNISINGTPVLTDVLYADSTGYLPVSAGKNQIQIFPSGSSMPAISTTVTLTDDMDFTAIAVGGANEWGLELKLLKDDNSTPASGSAKVRIGHLAPFAAGASNTLADVRLQDGTLLPGFDDVPYGVIAGYISLPADEYDLKVTSADGSTTLIDPLPFTLNDGDILSVFAVGDGVNQPVGIFALPSGAPGALVDLAAALQIAHLAPFAEDATLVVGTSVTVRLNGMDVLTGVKFADSTGYLPVPAGWNQVQIIPTGASDPAISATVYLTHAMDFTALAVGGANGWGLDLKLLKDDNSMPASGSAKVRIGHLAPFADGASNTLADVRMQDGTLLPGFDDVPYGVIAGYISLPADEYDLKVTSADGSITLIDPLPFTLNDGDILSVFAVGDGTKQPLGIFALPSGAPGALVDLAAALQIAHLAPFAEDATLVVGTSVTVRLNGTDVLTGVKFVDSTGYLPVPAGWNQVQIIPTGASDPAISATVYLTHALDFTALAVGGANEWGLDLKLLKDDNSMPASGNAKVRIGHLAPFAAGASNTLADVRMQDSTILPGFDDVPYGVIADYILLPANEYDLKVTSADGSTTLIDPLPFTLNSGDILSVFAVGDGTKQSLGIFALPGGAPGALLPLEEGYAIYLPMVLRAVSTQ